LEQGVQNVGFEVLIVTVSIFRVEEYAKLAACFMLVSCLAYSSTLKMEVICSSETLVDFQQTTW
jgi:hypothetical protein